jgi:hypothetical protein
VLAMIILVISALNISNAGISQLTGEERKAVLAVKLEGNDLHLQFLGEEYQYLEPVANCTGYIKDLGLQIKDYLYSIGQILKAVVPSI